MNQKQEINRFSEEITTMTRRHEPHRDRTLCLDCNAFTENGIIYCSWEKFEATFREELNMFNGKLMLEFREEKFLLSPRSVTSLQFHAKCVLDVDEHTFGLDQK